MTFQPVSRSELESACIEYRFGRNGNMQDSLFGRSKSERKEPKNLKKHVAGTIPIEDSVTDMRSVSRGVNFRYKRDLDMN